MVEGGITKSNRFTVIDSPLESAFDSALCTALDSPFGAARGGRQHAVIQDMCAITKNDITANTTTTVRCVA